MGRVLRSSAFHCVSVHPSKTICIALCCVLCFQCVIQCLCDFEIVAVPC
nr:MAG TPA: hypothetical protein [Bacteriophage sp.]